MTNKVLKTIALVIAAHFSFQLTAQIMTKNAPTYPATRKDPSVSDDYHGTKVADPYRWLEDDNAAETKEWVKKQNEVTFGYLEKIPFREAIKSKLTTLWNYEKFGSPFKEGNKYYFYRNSGLQNQAVLYVQDALNATPSVFLDPFYFIVKRFARNGVFYVNSLPIRTRFCQLIRRQITRFIECQSTQSDGSFFR